MEPSSTTNLLASGDSGCPLILGKLCPERSAGLENPHTAVALCADLYWQEDANGVCTGICSYSAGTALTAKYLFNRQLRAIGGVFSQAGSTPHWQQYLDATSSRKPFRQLHCLISLQNGSDCFLQISGAPQFDEQGVFLGYECLAIDITREQRQETSLQRFRAAMDMSMDMIYLVDRETLSFVDVNDTACQNAGLTRQQMLAMGPMEILGFTQEELIARYDRLINEGQSSRIERKVKRLNGQSAIIEIHSRATRINGRWIIIGVSRDISERKKAESESLKLQRLFSALSLTNEAILRATTVDQLYEHACQAAVSSELFAITSVLIPNASGHFYARTTAGNVLPIMKKTRVSSDPGQPEGRSMTAIAYRTGRALFSNDFLSDERTAAWHEHARLHGIASAAALPLFQQKKPIAVMVFYSAEKDMFDERTQSILQSIADNTSFALDSFASAAEQATASERIRQNEERFRSLTNLSSDFYWEMDRHLRFTLYEGRIIGHSNKSAVESAIGHTLWENPGVEPDSMNWKQFRRQLKKEQAFRDFEFSFTNIDGHLYHLTLSGEPMLDSDGQFDGYRGVTRDITGKKRIANHIKFLATHDTLTGLPNRVMFSELLGQAIRNANRYKDQRFAVLFIDLDRFKAVNDTYGHQTGDLLLTEVASRLKVPLRNSDIVARLGGDEFVVLLQKVSDRDHAGHIASNILKIFGQPITLEQREFLISASIGISLYGVDANNEEALMTHADTAMYAAKEEGRNNYRLYSAELHQHKQERAGLAIQLRHALSRGELSLNYQAKLELSTGRVAGVEALLRWHHPELGEIPPNQFIPIAEDNGLIVPIGEWVIATACRQVLEWQQKGLPPLSLAVNLSARQFNHPELTSYIRQTLESVGFPAEQLELEITESVVMQNPEHAISLMQEMKRLGIRFALDDFGTGYSSLGQLRHYPIDTLKIDRAFIRDLASSREDQAISKAIISMSKTLGLSVVAEGVENLKQMDFLRHYQCDQIQGFFYHRPATAERFVIWYHQQSGETIAAGK
ncbi:MAG: EAL domain-containing protein [Pseudohongiella sp.]|nr:EAL domain-containing protein [Pseudohongiella sp.]